MPLGFVSWQRVSAQLVDGKHSLTGMGPCLLAPDAVVTAARMAGEAHKRGDGILCSESVEKALQQSSRNPVKLVFVGSTMLKGKRRKCNVYVPAVALYENEEDECDEQDSEAPVVIGTMLQRIADGIGKCLGPSPSHRLVLVEGMAGMFKSNALNGALDQLGRMPDPPAIVRVSCGSVDEFLPYSICHQILNKLARLTGQPQAIPNLWIQVWAPPLLHSVFSPTHGHGLAGFFDLGARPACPVSSQATADSVG